jgi:malonyl-CoA decarboxylase
VHAIDSWEDLRRRLEPADRRCFAFFHPAMPDEPLIFVEVALTKGVPGSIQALLAEDAGPDRGEKTADTAVFYSISNCQEGLASISFGNSLIKQVAADLSLELPKLSTFVTLSPIPGLARWLAAEKNDAAPIRRSGRSYWLAAHYLVELPSAATACRSTRWPGSTSATARRFTRCTADADLSEKGLRQSGGVMVNYLYDLKRRSRRTTSASPPPTRSRLTGDTRWRGRGKDAAKGEKPMPTRFTIRCFGAHAGKRRRF